MEAYVRRLGHNFSSLRESGSLCDTVLITADRQLEAHSIILAAASHVFRAAFQSCTSESCTQYRLQLDGVDGALMETILNCIYCGCGAPLVPVCSASDLECVMDVCKQLGVEWILGGDECSLGQSADTDRLIMATDCGQPNEPLHHMHGNEMSCDLRCSNTPSVSNLIDADLNHSRLPLPPAAADVLSITYNDRCYVCDVCSLRLSTSHELQKHRRRHKHCAMCTNCGLGFKSSIHLRHHSKWQCLKQTICNICQQSFRSGADLFRHTLTIHSTSYRCADCGQAYDSLDLLSVHRSQHAMKLYRCRLCRRAFQSSRCLRKHIVRHVTRSTDVVTEEKGLNEYRLDVGSQLIVFENQLSEDSGDVRNCVDVSEIGCIRKEPSVIHQVDIASEEYKLTQVTQASLNGLAGVLAPAQNCDKGAELKPLFSHAATVLSGQDRVTCAQCSQTFKRMSDLHVHMRCHTDEMRYKCDVCGRPFRKSGTLSRHMRIHTGERPYVCETCGKSYKLLFHLRLHSTVHSVDRPFSCDVCGKTFQTALRLKQHRFVHTGVKPYRCPVCMRLFNRGSNMRAHMRVHDAGLPTDSLSQNEHASVLCGRNFSDSANLQSHLQTECSNQIQADAGSSLPAAGLFLGGPASDLIYCKVDKQSLDESCASLPVVHFDDFDVE